VTIDQVVSSVLLALGGIVIAANWMAVWTRYVDRMPRSFVPLLGGIATLAGCATNPTLDWHLGLFALVVDPGTLLLPIARLARLTR